MAVSNPSAATASQPKSQSPDLDIEQLVGLLGSLMPLLLHFQSQTQQQPYQADNFMVPNPALDRQAAESLIGDMIAETLRTLSVYLESNAGLHAGLESCVPIVTQAAHRFAARDYAQAFNLIWLTYRAIETIRAADSRVPPPRAAASDPTSSSIH
ncbi:MAG TPA: hypothetical protein VNO35_34840 [Steroidobacteraceae bacterium]|jgi:hypothetical protein|nr:hypothetical protein [Steroidobacteraceae bacterium]